MNELFITEATKEDLPAILDVQKKAFLEVARIFHLKSLPPLAQTLESVNAGFINGMILKASLTPSHLLDSRLRGNDKDSLTIVGWCARVRKKIPATSANSLFCRTIKIKASARP